MDLQELSQWMKERNLKGHWEHSEWSQTVKPFLWKGDEIMQALNWSGELITTGEAGRRTIQMRNPGLAAGMTNTVHISVQLVKPGEVAAAHRHTAAAIRFIVKGTPNAYTIVEGERFPMFEGDFITTPNWTWHDHFNGSNEPVMWLDGLDVRLVTHFGAMIQENFKKEQQPIERPDNLSSKCFPTRVRPGSKIVFKRRPTAIPGKKPTRACRRSKKAPAIPTMGFFWNMPTRSMADTRCQPVPVPSNCCGRRKKPSPIATPARRFTMLFAARDDQSLGQRIQLEAGRYLCRAVVEWHSHENATERRRDPLFDQRPAID